MREIAYLETKAKGKIKVCIVCQCGMKICGNSEDNAKANLEIHRKSITHKAQMEGLKILKEGVKK